MRQRYLATAVVAVVLAGGLAAGWYAASLPARVAVAHPSRGPAVEAIYATGTVEPVRWVKAGPTVPGRIAAFACEEGARVKAGQVLLRLDDAAARARLAELEAGLRFRQQEVERYRALLKREAASRQAYERALSDMDQGLAAVAAARQALTDTAVTSPLDGIILREDGEVGQVVHAGDPLCWIGQERPLRVTAEVDEEDIPRLGVGQRALITVDAFPDATFEGRVSDITPQGDPVNKSYRAHIALPEDAPLPVGMTAEVNVVVREAADAVLVPLAAVRNGAVWVVEEGIARRRPVRPGVFGDELVEIRDGLAGDESVILDPPPDLADGDPVRASAR